MEHIKTIAMMGKPGSGKGTQARLLSEVLGFDLFSSGDSFRELATKDTPLGHKVKDVIDKAREINDAIDRGVERTVRDTIGGMKAREDLKKKAGEEKKERQGK